MATDTSIEWADKTWSPLIGCDRVSPGCDGCYAITTAHIRTSHPNPKISTAFAGTTHRANGRIDWTGQINQLEDRLTQPLAWKKPRKVFVNSQSDLFHKNVDIEFIAKVFAVMALTPRHTYQILTKRHARMRSLLTDRHFAVAVRTEMYALDRDATLRQDEQWPLPNVHLGVSVENQQWADIRIPALLDTPAAVRWISAEPLLGPIDLTDIDGMNVLNPSDTGHENGLGWIDGPSLNWVVAGGESGPKARPANPDWFRTLRDQCLAADVPFLFKQWGEYAPTGYLVIGGTSKGALLVGEPVDDFGHRVEIARVGKKAAGRELDGRTWDQYPDNPGD
ncbi:phage Gp37/Gp68 family protein [Streptomyces sp. NBC_01240]|uniref:phage Gp37/Gp68 family protein n=1 Tax=Streptomyces sp. NBC_01240 TaxID=2903793 RepID=UPI002E159800|nr:phage Gp37/Gp68 family protein [Streptomyces sp. NBC_01240]